MKLKDAPFDSVLVMMDKIGTDRRLNYYRRRVWRFDSQM